MRTSEEHYIDKIYIERDELARIRLKLPEILI